MADNNDNQNPRSIKNSTLIIAIMVPAVIAAVVLTLIVTAFVLPRFSRDTDDIIKEDSRKKRLDELNSTATPQPYHDWLASQKEKGTEAEVTVEPLCTICLEEFAEDSQVRDLKCTHAFHAHCLDEWFGRYNDYCPLCHRQIVPGASPVRHMIPRRQNMVPIAFMA